jgi:endoglucanase Acf2
LKQKIEVSLTAIKGHMKTIFKQKAFCLLTSALFGLGCCVELGAQTIKLGEGGYQTSPRGWDLAAPKALMRTEAMQKMAAPTNQWYSNLMFNKSPEAIYAQPLSVRPIKAGLEFSLPSKEVVPTERRDVEIQYLHKDPIVLAPVGFEPEPAKLAKASDWAIDIELAKGNDRMLATVAHGSPYIFLRLSRGDLRISLPDVGERINRNDDSRVLSIKVKDKAYGFFGPTGIQWEQVSNREWIARLPAGKGYVTAAALPDQTPESLALLAQHAYAFTTNTQVTWKYDAASSQVATRFRVTTEVMEGQDKGALVGLYPHQWFGNESVNKKLGPAYSTVRGKIHLLAESDFTVSASYGGFVPFWPAVKDPARLGELNDVMKIDLRNARRMMLEVGTGPYWQGKGLQRITKLMEVFEQQGNLEARDQLLDMLKSRVQEWFSGDSRRTYFHLDKSLGTVLGYAEEYFSVEQMNDHHFHYGYWIRAMADIAIRDPEWASSQRWGGMTNLLVADIATTQRGAGDFPFLRNFDAYEGHSWASGVALGPYGNNQESSSEAINAWAALILWAEVTGNDALRDLGVYLYTSEKEAARHYWFDVKNLVIAPEYKNTGVSMLFGAKYAHNTWWTDEPRQIKGINLLPMTSASVYLAQDRPFIDRSLAALKTDIETFESRGKQAVPRDIWQDIFAKYLGLSNPALALKQWDRWGSVELGDTRTHTLHWLMSLNEMGVPDQTVSADTPLYSVFRRGDGTLTYLAFNGRKSPISVRFSTGKVIDVPPGKLVRVQ